LYGIQPDKWSFTGTRKFEGDFFDFIDEKFGDDPDYMEYVRGIWEDEEAGELLCPEMFTHPIVPSYEQDLIDGKEDLERVRKHVGEYVWWSDFEQQPRVISGGVWKGVKFISDIESPVVKFYDMAIFGIDRATTKNTSSDYTGCIEVFRNKKDGSRLITHDYTDKISLEDLLILINDRVMELKLKYGHMVVYVVVEKQGGGDDFIENAKTRIEFTKWVTVKGKKDLVRIPNKIPDYAVLIPVYNTKDKEQRVKDRLNAPISNERLQCVVNLKHSEVVKEIVDFPNLQYDDAIDALANIEYEMLNHQRGVAERASRIVDVFLDYEEREKAMEEKRAMWSTVAKRYNNDKKTVFE